ncbi:mycofactocin system FadH/OYE family oxidoreductase 1 [Dermatobacter hominis]|uniref:mycofactocin system FadH/OYE family oxidoreductase 1 n=1 Tax=Dermatobacter hominis TaxID=2884263 RepID=UPI001D12DB11|nr:mycofactocin system FadH/OYE family oxidoreductase 1 [Dermatobacter hominis]UDY37774.1 mycofactocin system FadH/OYE family oxidoreductase 1 [Dermatobacter hominis]
MSSPPDGPPAGLLDPLTIGGRTAPNRVVFGPHETNLGRGRAISERHVAYYERRARGGAGTIVVEEASVHASDWPLERAPLASECGPGWAEVVDACRPHGTLVLAALGHSGGQGTSHWSQRELWAPSRVPEVNTREVPKWMEAADVAEVVDGFAAAARLAVESGCDGVEVNAGQFSLVRQFLSGLTNQRDDEWGADRALFARQVLAAVRGAVGPDAVVALRLSCDELAPWAGITPEAAEELAAGFAADDGDGRIDLLTVVKGSIFSAGATRPDGHIPQGFNLDLTRAVRAAVRAVAGDRVAVVAQGSIVDVGQAGWALADGVADAVEMTRAQLADADLVRRLRDGEPERIRPCVLCNQTCMVRDNRNPIVTCIVDPATGHETEDAPVPDVVAPLDPPAAGTVLVAGGGVAGLEAARVAALAGHRVQVVERGERTGGAARTTALLPGRDRFALFADWLEAECARLGVDVRTGSTVDAATAEAAAHVVVATGGRPGEPTFEVLDGPDGPAVAVLTPSEVLEDPSAVPEGAVLVWDPIGGPVGVGVAELLAAAGREVHLATPDQILGNELARAGDLAPANARLAQAGVVAHRRSVLRSVGAKGAVLEHRFDAATTDLVVGSVVDAGHRLPDDALWHEIRRAAAGRAVQVGDSVAPRTVHEAVLEGRRAALELG